MSHPLSIKLQPKGLSIAPKTLANFLDRMAQLFMSKVQTIDASGREKVSDRKCNLVKIENLYRNYFTQVLQKRS